MNRILVVTGLELFELAAYPLLVWMLSGVYFMLESIGRHGWPALVLCALMTLRAGLIGWRVVRESFVARMHYRHCATQVAEPPCTCADVCDRDNCDCQ